MESAGTRRKSMSSARSCNNPPPERMGWWRIWLRPIARAWKGSSIGLEADVQILLNSLISRLRISKGEILHCVQDDSLMSCHSSKARNLVFTPTESSDQRPRPTRCHLKTVAEQNDLPFAHDGRAQRQCHILIERGRAGGRSAYFVRVTLA